MSDEIGAIPDRIPEVDGRIVPCVEVLTVDMNPYLEGALLLALDELIQGHADIARSILLAAKVGTELYVRARSQKDVEALRRMALAAQGEWP